MAAEIVRNRARLSSEYSNVGSWVGRSAVDARTNKEAILILFYGRVDGSWLDSHRVGYVYYTGTMVPALQSGYYSRPGMLGSHFRLTNSWYEFGVSSGF